MTSPTALVQKLWNYCNILRDNGPSYCDYLEQLIFLLFLKMAGEQSKPPYRPASAVPAGYDWPRLMARDSDEQQTLGKHACMLGVIDKLEALVNANLQRATRLRQPILQKAFTKTLIA